MIFVGYSLALIMGLTLGLVGAGGSILTVPILVYFLNVKPITATSYSLLIVGLAACLATLKNWYGGKLRIHTILAFSLPAMLTVSFTRAFILPSIPETLGIVSKDAFIMIFFSGLMFLASMYMLRSPSSQTKDKPASKSYASILLGAIGVGLLTGMVGAGGGFLIVPSLMVFFGLQVKEAIHTSLAIIMVNSLFGLSGDIHAGIIFDWHLLLGFIGCTFTGILLGTTLDNYVSASALKQGFGYFILVISLVIFLNTLYEVFL